MRPRDNEGSWPPTIEAFWHAAVDALPTPTDTVARCYKVCRIGRRDVDTNAGAALILIADTSVPPVRSGYVARAGHTGSW
jgi:hypothetical protein